MQSLKGIWTWYLLFQIPLHSNQNSRSISRSDKSNTKQPQLNRQLSYNRHHFLYSKAYTNRHHFASITANMWLLGPCVTTDNISIISRHGDSNVEETENQPLVFFFTKKLKIISLYLDKPSRHSIITFSHTWMRWAIFDPTINSQYLLKL